MVKWAKWLIRYLVMEDVIRYPLLVYSFIRKSTARLCDFMS